MKPNLKTRRRRIARRRARAALKPVRAPKLPARRDMIAYAAALEILG